MPQVMGCSMKISLEADLLGWESVTWAEQAPEDRTASKSVINGSPDRAGVQAACGTLECNPVDFILFVV